MFRVFLQPGNFNWLTDNLSRQVQKNLEGKESEVTIIQGEHSLYNNGSPESNEAWWRSSEKARGP